MSELNHGRKKVIIHINFSMKNGGKYANKSDEFENILKFTGGKK